MPDDYARPEGCEPIFDGPVSGSDNGFQWGGWFCDPVDDWRVFVDRFFGILKTAEILRNARRGSFLGDQAKLKHLVKILPCPESFDDLPAAWCAIESNLNDLSALGGVHLGVRMNEGRAGQPHVYSVGRPRPGNRRMGDPDTASWS